MSARQDFAAMLRDRRHVAATFRRRGHEGSVSEMAAALQADALGLSVIHPQRVPVRLAERWDVSPSAVALRLTPEAGSFPPFLPGQYVSVHATVDGAHTARPYSICSPSTRLDHIELLVRHGPDGFVAPWLARGLSVGDRLEVSAPAGEFGYDPVRDGDDLLLIAGGTGVAPMLSILRDMQARSRPNRALLLLGSRHRAEILYADRLAELASSVAGLRVVHVLSEPGEGWDGERGFLDEACLRRHLGPQGAEGRTTFVCGPAPMTEGVAAALSRLGVPAHRVRKEPFGMPSDPTTLPGWPADLDPAATWTVRLSSRGRSLSAPAGEPLLNSLERAGVLVPSLCRVGQCGCCRSRLLKGSVLHAPSVRLRPSDEADGIVHPCCAYPLSDLELELPGPRR